MRIRRSFVLSAIVAGLLPAPAQALISFGPPAPLNSTAATDLADVADDDVDFEVSIANDGAMNWVAAWKSDNSLGGTIGDDFDILVATSSDDGETWSPVEAATSDAATDVGATDSQPKVGFGNGVFVMVFSSNNPSGGGGGDNEIRFTRSTDLGATWAASGLLNSAATTDTAADSDQQPSIATDGAGNWIVVWQRFSTLPTGIQILYSYSVDDGQTWAAQAPLGGLQSVAVGNGQGNAVAWVGAQFVAIWGSSEDLGSNGTDGDILFSILAPPTYTATAAALLNDTATTDAATESDQYPALSSNGSIIVAAWESNANIDGSGTDDDILYALSGTGGASWGPAELLASNGATDTGEDNKVALANDGSTFLAVWDSTDPLGKLSKADRDIFVARSDDSGSTWSDTDVIATTAAKDKGADIEAAIAANAATGTWDIAWQSDDTLSKSIGADEDILFVHSSEDCPAAPVAAATCFESTVVDSSKLLIKNNGFKDQLLWKFVKGEAVNKAADIGAPGSTDDYAFCVYGTTAAVPALAIELDIEAGGNCFVKPCWKESETGFLYKHKAGAVSVAQIAGGAEGLSKASIKAKAGFRAPLPIANDPSVSVRLHNLANGKCFASDYTTFSQADETFLKAP